MAKKKTKKTKSKSKPKKKSEKPRKKQPTYMVRVNDPINLRKEVLESLKETIIFMQNNENFRRIQQERKYLLDHFKMEVKELNNLISTQLKKHFPKGALDIAKKRKVVVMSHQEIPVQPMATSVTPPAIEKPVEVKRAPSELDELEAQLRNIEMELKKVS